MLVVLRSGSLSSAISRTCFIETLPILFLFGSPEPFSTFAALFKRIEAGGVLVMNVKLRSAYAVMSTGMIRSPSLAVRALNSLQNCMMFKPCCPSAGPTGGAGFALPAGHCSLMIAVTFFMTGLYRLWGRTTGKSGGLDDLVPSPEGDPPGSRGKEPFMLSRPGRSQARPTSH